MATISTVRRSLACFLVYPWFGQCSLLLSHSETAKRASILVPWLHAVLPGHCPTEALSLQTWLHPRTLLWSGTTLSAKGLAVGQAPAAAGLKGTQVGPVCTYLSLSHLIRCYVWARAPQKCSRFTASLLMPRIRRCSVSGKVREQVSHVQSQRSPLIIRAPSVPAHSCGEHKPRYRSRRAAPYVAYLP